MRIRRYLAGVAITAALMAGAVLTFREDARRGERLGRRSDLPDLTFFTTPGATAPQIPFWAGWKSGELPRLFNLRVELWKDLDDLHGVLLAGRGDLWLGHLEGFALARRRGAPITLLAVTGWRKFSIVSRRSDVSRLEDFVGKTLPFTPAGSPAVPIMKALVGRDAEGIEFQPHEPRQLSMLMMRGAFDSALAPEPLVTTMLLKIKGLRVVAGLEQVYGERLGRPPRLPIAGIAVNTGTAASHPEIVGALLRTMQEEARRLREEPDQAAASLPDSFSEFVPREIVRASLDRDPILVEPASAVESEIADYFRLIAPELVTADGRLAMDPDFIWR